MTPEEQLTAFELAVLRSLESSNKPLGWYQIEIRLSNMALEERPPLPAVLAALRDRGFVSEAQSHDVPQVRYSLTSQGRNAVLTGSKWL